MMFDVEETVSEWPQTAYACTAERQGIWTLWWRYEMMRSNFDRADQLNLDELPVESTENLMLNDVEIATDSLMSIRTVLEKNGLWLLH